MLKHITSIHTYSTYFHTYILPYMHTYIPDVPDNEVGTHKYMVHLAEHSSGRVAGRHISDGIPVLQVDSRNL